MRENSLWLGVALTVLACGLVVATAILLAAL